MPMTPHRRRLPLAALLLSLATAIPLASAVGAAPLADEAAPDREAVAKAIAPSFVIVELTLRQDRGESPNGRVGASMFEQYIGEERPLELPGFLVDEHTVVVRDPEVPARFIASTSVRQGSHAVEASTSAWFTEDGGMLLTLAKPLPGAKPLTFLPKGAKPSGPIANVRAQDAQGIWALTVGSPEDRFALEFHREAETPIHLMPNDSVSVDAAGHVVAFGCTSRRSDSSDASNDPRTWPALDTKAMAQRLQATGQRADGSILRTTLHFRSPRKTQGGGRHMFEQEHEVATELETMSVLLSGGELLVLADLPNSATARLESIDVIDGTGSTHAAQFVATLRDWGALLAKPKDGSAGSLGAGIALSTADLAPTTNHLLMSSSVRIVGRARVSDPTHVRIGGFDVGWRGIRMPSGIVDAQSAYLFAPDGALAAFPLSKREQPGERDRWSRPFAMLTPASVVATALAARESSIDPTNIPLSEEEEARTGWLGALMQPLDPELARANQVAELTRDGQFGGIVTFVYPDSPAAKAGIEPGMILLSITTPRRQQPIEIALEEMDLGWPGVFPWERLDELPEEYYDQIPAPWPPIEDSLNQTLTELGIGSGYQLELANNGTTERKSLVVEQSPPHFANAPKFEAKDMGMTVRDLTLEVRQYLNLAADAPGVIISKLEPGQRASVAGVRPFEIIESVDDVPVASAEAFGKAIAGKNDLRFTVKRAQKERVVKVSLTSPTGGGGGGGSSSGAATEGDGPGR